MLVGVILALLQLRHVNRLRQLEIVMRLYAQFGSDAFQRHYWRVMRWKFRSFEAFERRATREDYISWWTVSAFFEGIGLLYHRRFVSLALLDDLMSGPIIDSWVKTRTVVEGYRQKSGHPQLGEWRQQLAETMQRRLAKMETSSGKRKAVDAAGAATAVAKPQGHGRGKTSRRMSLAGGPRRGGKRRCG